MRREMLWIDRGSTYDVHMFITGSCASVLEVLQTNYVINF